jgi:hypothetical protein
LVPPVHSKELPRTHIQVNGSLAFFWQQNTNCFIHFKINKEQNLMDTKDEAFVI